MQGWCYNEDVFSFADELGPAKVIQVYEGVSGYSNLHERFYLARSESVYVLY